MVSHEEEEDDDRGQWRQQVSELRDRFTRPIVDRETFLDLVLGPLDLLNLVPAHLGEVERIHADWLRLQLGKASRTQALRSYKWIEDVQDALLRNVLPDWSRALDDHLVELVVQQWFAPSDTDEEACGHLLLSSLAVLTHMLSETAKHADDQRKETKQLLVRAVTYYLRHASLSRLAAACQAGDRVTATATLRWQDACRQLVSLPTRIANAFGAEVPTDLEFARVQQWILQQLEMLVWKRFDATIVGTLLQRIIRQGLLSGVQDWRSEHSTGWSGLLRAIGNRITDAELPTTYIYSWQKTVGSFSSDEQIAFFTNLLVTIDTECLVKQQIAGLVSAAELSRAGAEGMSFSSPQAWQKSLVITHVLSMFLVGEDGDTSDDAKSVFLSQILTQRKAASFSPSLVRLLVHLLGTLDVEYERSAELLRVYLKSWSTNSKTATPNEEVTSATMIGLLIAAAPENAGVIQSLSTSTDFVTGVSTHLEHLSPVVRRLGMLLAEVASERAGKGLSFSKKIWDGRGEGREEARVLRAAILSFPQRVKSYTLSKEAFLSALNLTAVPVLEAQVRQTYPLTKPVRQPKTRMLRQRVSAKERNTSVALIDSTPGDLPSLNNISGTRKQKSLITPISDDEASSSSSTEEDDSSDDDHNKAGDGTLPGEATEEGKAFGMGVPGSKSKLRPPIYMNELGPLLRKNERETVRMALRYGKDLIERKAGWGAEVNESAVEVCMALCALQNNFGIAEFEQRRLDMLSSLAAASPVHVAPCLTEQYFLYQYSMTQRISMLNALAFAATRLATGQAVESDRSKNQPSNVGVMANDVSASAIKRARKEGDARMPEIQREKALLVKPAVYELAKKQSAEHNHQAINKYNGVALTSFIFPLMTRTWNHLQNSSGSGLRYGRGVIDMPFMVGALLDTLAVLCYHAQSEPQFRSKVVPEVIDLSLTITRPHLSILAENAGLPLQHDEEGGGTNTILGAASSLILILLDACWQLDFGASLLREHDQLIPQLQPWASALFEIADGGGEGNSIGRLGRTSAALLIRLNEITEHRLG